MKSLLRLRPYMKGLFGLILISTLLAIPLSLLRFSPAPLVKYFVDDLLVNRNASKLMVFPFLIIGLYLVNFVIRFFHYFLLRIATARLNQRVKHALFNHLLGLSSDYFTSQSIGTLISRAAVDPNYIDGGMSCINVLIREPFTFLMLFGYALYLDWKLTLITLTIFPLLAWVFAVTGRLLKHYIAKMSEENARVYSTLQESFSGIRIIKAFRLGKYIRKKFRRRVGEFTRLSLKTAALEEVSHPMVELLTAFAIAAVIYVGGSQVLSNKMTSGDLLAFFTAFALMMDPIRRLNDVNIKLNQAAAACDRIFEVMNWRPNLHQPANPRRVRGFHHSIRFDDVSFAYPDSSARTVLSGLRFEVPLHTVTALVGESGAGKTSLANLLPRIFDVTQGRILIDGVDIREFRLEDLRKLIAVVSQDVFLFNDTIEENIRCGRLSATPEEIRVAAAQAHALEFINEFPNGFKTVIGDRGVKLSGGERQRISIARAFLSRAPILILDEATSNLDSGSERMVQTAMEDLMKDRTTLVIAHRLSTIRHADQILVLKSGKVLESGKHDELLKMNGEYARFHKIHDSSSVASIAPSFQ